MRSTLQRVGLAVAAAVCVSAIAWPVYGSRAFLDSLAILAPLGAATSLLAGPIASHRARIHGIRHQLGALAVLALAQLAVALALFAAIMFVSHHDAFFMALAAGYACLVGLAAAKL